MMYLNLILRNIAVVLAGITWIAGLVLAKGFWLTALGVCVPFYSWYLVVERAMVLAGLAT
jgi:hypothetical protein